MNFSIQTRIGAFIVLILLSLSLLTSLISIKNERDLVEDLAIAQTKYIAQNFFDGLNTLMLTSSMRESDMWRKKIKSHDGVSEVRLIRSSLFAEHNGWGTSEQKVRDNLDERALKGEEVVELTENSDGRVISVLQPIRAKSNLNGINCISCHAFPEGSILGVVRIDYSLVKLDAQIVHSNILGLLGIFVLGVISALILTLYINRGVLRQLGGEPVYAAHIAEQIANGKLDNIITLKKGDERSILANMRNMQQQLLKRITQEALEKAEALRIKKALDSASSSVMMADVDDNIIYVNDALIQMLTEATMDIRNELHNFDVANLLGSKIDIFRTTQVSSLEELIHIKTTFRSSILIGDRYLDFVANPVLDEMEQRVGTVVEWKDRTLDITIENEIKAIIENVKAGVLDSRLDTHNKSGFHLTLSVGINELTNIIEKVLKDIADVMQYMAAGDLTHPITSEYEGVYGKCKNDINSTLAKLKEVYSQIKDSAEFVNNSSQELANGNNNLSKRAEEQASSLVKTAASMQELTSTVKNNADNSQHANLVANNAQKLAQKGGLIVSSAVKAMQEINESSNKIAAIIGVIDEIAFQTNLLALNASVEAARAAEHGRGFSVVATEVRNLSQRSSAAAHQSKELIQNSIEKVRIGADYVNQTGNALAEIVAGVIEVNTIISEIAAATIQQSSGIEQVNVTITKMDEITQQNAALAEQTSSVSIAMSEQASRMSSLLAFFRLDDGIRHATLTNNVHKVILPDQKVSIDLDSAMQKHIEWKIKLRNAISRQETLDPVTISKDNCCDFGKWLYGEGKLQYEHKQSFKACLSNHAQFHKEAAKVAVAINERNFDKAKDMLSSDSPYSKVSSAVGLAITLLKNDIKDVR